MAIFREFVARTLVVLALALAAAALGTWWASLLVVRTAGTLSSVMTASASSQIASELDRLVPGTSNLSQVQGAISQALRDPSVTQALATSVPGGSSALTEELTRLDSGLGPLLGSNHLLVNVGQHTLARLAERLRTIARVALLAGVGLALAALVVSPLRHIVLRHLAAGVGTLGGLAILATWAVPALIGRFTKGDVHHETATILSGGSVVRTVVLECFAGGFAVYALTHLFELVGGRSLQQKGAVAPLPQGKVL